MIAIIKYNITHSNKNHGFLPRIGCFLNSDGVGAGEIRLAQLFSFSVDCENVLLRAEFEFDHPFVVLVQPLFHSHLVYTLSLVVLLLAQFELAAAPVLQFHHSVCGSRTQNRHKAQEDAGVNVGQFTPLNTQ